MKDFAGNKLIVIGGTSGMGKKVAELVLKRGGSAAVVGRRDDHVAAAVAELEQFGVVDGKKADLTTTSDANALRSWITSRHTDANLLVNAAGVFVPKPFLDHTAEDYDRYLSINRELFFVTQTVARNSTAPLRFQVLLLRPPGSAPIR